MSGAEAGGGLENPSGFSLAMNFLPVLLLGSGVGTAVYVVDGVGARSGVLLGWIYLAPPLVARVLISVRGKPQGRLTQEMQSYRLWWVLTQLQMPFNRVALLEELLRLVPGFYPAWIALWGGHLSAFAYVGPGVVITDRYAVDVGRGAVLGFKSVLAGHMVVRDERGRFVVVVAAPKVEAEAMVGGGAGLGPGARLRAGHVLPTGRRVGPHGVWPRANIKVGDA